MRRLGFWIGVMLVVIGAVSLFLMFNQRTSARRVFDLTGQSEAIKPAAGQALRPPAAAREMLDEAAAQASANRAFHAAENAANAAALAMQLQK
jgi:hypothetical protein